MGLGQHRSDRDVSDTLKIDFVHALGTGSYSGEKFGAWALRPSCILLSSSFSEASFWCYVQNRLNKPG